MLSRTSVLSYVEPVVTLEATCPAVVTLEVTCPAVVTLEATCPAVDTDVLQVRKSAELRDSDNSRSRRSSLSKFVQRISGVMKNKKKVKRHSHFDFPHLDSGFGSKVNTSEFNWNPQLAGRSSTVISRRRYGNDVVFDTESCVSRLPADRRMSLSIEHTCVPCDENTGDRRMSLSMEHICVPCHCDMSLSIEHTCVPCDENPGDRPQSSNLLHNEKTRSRFYRKLQSRGPYVSPRKFDILPCPFTHKKARSPFKHLNNQSFDSCNLGQLSLPCIQTFGSPNHTDLALPEPCEFLNQTVDSKNNCHKQTLNPAKPVCGDTNMEGTELEAAGSEYNINTDSDVQGRAGRVASWAVHFDKLLQDPLGINIFTKFLEKEFSDENIRFWQVCQQFRTLTDQRQQQALAKDIYSRHIGAQANDPVNIDGAAKWHTLQFLDIPTADMFDVAQKQIHRLMKLDSYPRFLKSDLYKNVLLEEMEGKIHHEPEKTGEIKQDKKQNAGKKNGRKRRKSLLPWMRFL